MKHTLLKHTKYIVIGLVLALSAVAYAEFTAPTSTAPGANKPVPVHAGGSQVKAGGLSVMTFSVAGDTRFDQQTFISGPIRGGLPTSTTTASTVNFGDATNNTNIKASGDISADAYLKSTLTASTNANNALCADANGVISSCKKEALN